MARNCPYRPFNFRLSGIGWLSWLFAQHLLFNVRLSGIGWLSWLFGMQLLFNFRLSGIGGLSWLFAQQLLFNFTVVLLSVSFSRVNNCSGSSSARSRDKSAICATQSLGYSAALAANSVSVSIFFSSVSLFCFQRGISWCTNQPNMFLSVSPALHCVNPARY